MLKLFLKNAKFDGIWAESEKISKMISSRLKYCTRRSVQSRSEIIHLCVRVITSWISHFSFIQIEIFKGLLFETEINISKCVLANVEELTQPISECARMMKNFLTDGNRGFIRLNGPTANDEMHVQLYKTVNIYLSTYV